MSKASVKGIRRFYPDITNPNRRRRMHISTDIGGTFTDFVIFDGGTIKTFKVPSTSHKPAYFEHEGPAIIEGKDSTTVVPPDMSFSVDGYGNIVICNYEGRSF